EANGAFTITLPVPEGKHQMSARATDKETGLSGTSTINNIWVDLHEPSDFAVQSGDSVSGVSPAVFTSPGWFTGLVVDAGTGTATVAIGPNTNVSSQTT